MHELKTAGTGTRSVCYQIRQYQTNSCPILQRWKTNLAANLTNIRRIEDMEDALCSRKRKHKSKGWSRNEICACHCEDLAYKHVHCPCDQCSGKAVPTSTEYRHWQHNMYLDHPCDTRSACFSLSFDLLIEKRDNVVMSNLK